MRIGLVVTGGVDRSGRTHVVPALIWLIERLAREHELFVYVLRYHQRPCSYRLRGATIRDLGSPRGLARQSAALLQAVRREGRLDVLHGYWALPAGLAAALVGRGLRLPTVVTCDSGEYVAIPDVGYGLQQRLRQRLAVAAAQRLARRLTVCSEYQATLARRHRAAPVVVPIGVPIDRFVPSAGAAGPPWRLLHVANLNPVKDQTTLLTAMPAMLAAEPRLHLDIVGLDTLDGAMQRLADRLGVSHEVTFHGVLPTDAIVPLYQRAHLALLTSRHEAAGVATLEAAACGVPTVGTDVGYVHDWSPDAAVAVPVGDAAGLAAAVIDLLRAPDRRRRLGDAARALAVRHDADWTARMFASIYADLAG